MPEETTATIEKLFEVDVTIADNYRLRVVREGTENEERITGTAKGGLPFGNWNGPDEGQDEPNPSESLAMFPTDGEICRDVSAKLGFPVEFARDPDCVEIIETEGEKFGEVIFTFARKADEPKTLKDSVLGGDEPPQPPDENEAFKREIMAMEKECEESENAYLVAKERAKDLKDVFEGKVAEMRESIRKFGRPMPLFDKKPSTNGHAKPPDPELWRRVNMVELVNKDGAKLSETITDKLHEAGIDNLGQWCDYLAQEYPDKIKGIGKETRTKIDDCVDHYWVLHPRSPAEVIAKVADGMKLPVNDTNGSLAETFDHAATDADDRIDHHKATSDRLREAAAGDGAKLDAFGAPKIHEPEEKPAKKPGKKAKAK